MEQQFIISYQLSAEQDRRKTANEWMNQKR